jgi:UDP-MurNAc hydroxylase
MRVTALGHAGLGIETAHATVLVDPWFSPEGAFQVSWFQYPDNSHLLKPALFAPSAVVISHEHLDHFDPWFLARLPADVPTVIPRYPSPALRRKIASAGRRVVVELAPWEPFEVAPGTSVFFVSEPSPMNHDSAVVLRGDGHSLVDLNDARLFPVQLRAIRHALGGRVDAFAFQGAGASWYPMRYGYTPARAAELSRGKRLAKLAYVERSLRVLEPAVALPFAGPPCFLAPDLFELNREMEGGIFPDQGQVAAWLAGRGVANVAVLLPGDVWDTRERHRETDPTWEGFAYADRWTYLTAYASRRRSAIGRALARYPEPTGSLWEPFRDYFLRLLELSPYFNRKIGMRVGFEVTGPGGGCWAVDFRPGTEAVEAGSDRACGYVFRMASRWLPALLAGETLWEDFLLSLRFEARRDPDLYNDHLLGLLKFADAAALGAVEAFETSMASDERITVRDGDSVYRVGRHCPHAGSDLLETGEVLPGRILRCLAHHYEFDLETGRCLNGACPPLEVERVGPPRLPARGAA